MSEEAWRSVDVIKNKQGKPHVLQQKVELLSDGDGFSDDPSFEKPTVEHRLVPLSDLTGSQ